MGEGEAFVLEARPLSLEEFQSLCRLSQKYRDAHAGPKAIIRSKLAALVLLALIITCAILYNFDAYIEYPSIFGGVDRFFVLNGSWMLMLALYAFLLGVLMHVAGCAASGGQAIETEWSARLRLSWTETRIDHRGVIVEGPAAAVFQAWSTMTEVRSEAGLIAFVTNGVILLAVPEAVISTEERDRVVAYCAARIAETC